MKEYTVHIDGAPIEEDRNLGDQFYLDQVTFICEGISEKNKNRRICYNIKKPIIAICPQCLQLR